ncbi:MAG: ABC transporter transmembrane domain-containing protein, partial [Burkholderiaceae bacterium]
MSAVIANLAPIQPFVLRYRGHWFAAFFFLVLAAGAMLAVPLAFRSLIDAGFSAVDLNGRFLILLGLALTLGVATGLRFYWMAWLGERITADLRKAVYAHVLSQPPAFFETLKTGGLLSRLTADTSLVQTLVGTSISMALRSSLLLLGALTMMVVTSPKLALSLIGLLVVVVLPLWATGRRVRRLSRDSQDRLADSAARAGERLGAMPLVQAYQRESFEAQAYADEVDRALAAALRRNRLRSSLTALAIVLSFSVIVFTLWMGAQSVVGGRTSTGELAQFVFYAALVAGSMGALSEVFGDLQRAAGAAERLGELLPNPGLDRQALLERPQAPVDKPVDKPFEKSVSRAEPSNALVENPAVHEVKPGELNAHALTQTPVLAFLSDVHFAYPSSPNHRVLRGVDLEVRAGETVALVGPSGAGKSTVFQLLLGLYACNQGRVGLGSHDAYREARDCRARMAWVPQEPVLFSGTAFDNIRYGLLNASDEAVFAAAKMAHADDFIRALPEGYQSELGERGVRLSGGQRQRLALARAIVRNPDLLLLDEATSALDAESEALVQDTLDRWLPGRSSLVIAHRLATVRKAHRIVVMDGGKVVETGTHESLLAQNGLYARLARLQF